MARDQPPLALQKHLDVINVHWGSQLAFLYSGEDGMYGSKFGEKWTKAKTSVPASSLAWIDNVWVGCNGTTTWRSEDGGKSWQTTGLDFSKVAACKPFDVEADREEKGLFAAYRRDGDNELIYFSRDLGKTWSIELTIPMIIPFGDDEDGYEFVQALSGCGRAIFVGTIKGDSQYANGDGVVYVSSGFGPFSRQQVWTGTNDVPTGEDWVPDPHRVGYGAGSVGFDGSETGGESFCLTGLKEEAFGDGDIHYSVIYTISTDGIFSGEALVVTATTTIVPGGTNTGHRVAGGSSTAGGDGKFATTVRHDTTGAGNPPPVPADLDVHDIPEVDNAVTLLSVSDIFDGAQIGPICWKPSPNEDEEGIFACVAVGEGGTGVWVAPGGEDFVRKHSGTPFSPVSDQMATVAVGKLSWL